MKILTSAWGAQHPNAGQNIQQLIQVVCSLDQFKSVKLKDNKYTLNAPCFYKTLQQRRKRLMHQVLTFVGR